MVKIRKSTIVANMRYIGLNNNGLQIPSISIIFDGGLPVLISAYDEGDNLTLDLNFGCGPLDEVMEVPESYFFSERNEALTCGKESGFTFLSPLGFEALKPMLKEVFETLKTRPEVSFHPRMLTWEAAEIGVLKSFEIIKDKTQKKIDLLNKKASELQTAITIFQ